MASVVEQDEFDDEVVPAARPGSDDPVPVFLSKLNASAELRRRMDLLRVQERKMGMILGAIALVTLSTILGITWMVLFYGPAPDIAFTPATPRYITTENLTQFSDNDTDEAAVLPAELYPDQLERSVIDEEGDLNAGKMFCGTAVCQGAVRFLEDQLDPSYDACSNLYDHVCSRWLRQHKKQASDDGSTSVDGAIVGVYQDRMSILLSEKSGTFPKLRSLFTDCIYERLATEKDVTHILDTIRSIGNSTADEGIAKGIARMASLGVSPFFDVTAKVTNHTAYVRLLTASLNGKRSNSDVPNTKVGSQGLSTSAPGHKANSVLMNAFRHQLCSEIKQVTTNVKHCVLALSHNVTVRWNRHWFETTGAQGLRGSAIALLQPLLPHVKGAHGVTKDKKLQPPSPAEVSKERLRACLRLMEGYDSVSLTSLAADTVPPAFKVGAQETLRVLKASLDETFSGASSISFKLGPPSPVVDNETMISEYKGHVYDNVSTTGDSKLQTLLRAATWRQWLNHGSKAPAALSTASSFVESSSTLHVPLPVFNVTPYLDPWLRNVNLARVGPRVLKTLFRDKLGPELNGSRLAHCISRHQIRSRVMAEKGHDLDVKEVASFYTSLRAYRGQVGDAVTFSGSDLNSDSLFLLFYAFNNCAATSTDREPSLTETLGNRRRRQVDSVAAVFSSALLERCEGPVERVNCDVEIEPSIFFAARSRIDAPQ